MRIGLFGGTFDPVHLGHLRMAGAAKEALDLDRVILIPCALSPHKSDGPAPAPGECRMEMIRLCTVDHPWMEADSCELERSGVSYSYLTAEDFRSRYPEARLFWILGEDQWLALPRWSHPERLASLVEFVVFGRNGRTPVPREGYRAHFLPQAHDASATRIRCDIAAEAVTGRCHPWIAPPVMEYIREHRLYGAVSM